MSIGEEHMFLRTQALGDSYMHSQLTRSLTTTTWKSLSSHCVLGIVRGTRQAMLPVLSRAYRLEGKTRQEKMKLSQGVVPQYEKYRVIWEHTGGTPSLDFGGQKAFLRKLTGFKNPHLTPILYIKVINQCYLLHILRKKKEYMNKWKEITIWKNKEGYPLWNLASKWACQQDEQDLSV